MRNIVMTIFKFLTCFWVLSSAFSQEINLELPKIKAKYLMVTPDAFNKK